MTATATKTSLEVALLQNLPRLFPDLVQFFKCWQFFLELNFKRLFSKKKKRRCLVLTSSTKRGGWHFHVIVAQWRQRNVQQSVMHVQTCCFANQVFYRSRWRHCRRCLSSLLQLRRRRRLSRKWKLFLTSLLQAPAKIVGKASRKKWRENYARLEGQGGCFSFVRFFAASTLFSSVCADRQPSIGNTLTFRHQWKKQTNKQTNRKLACVAGAWK